MYKCRHFDIKELVSEDAYIRKGEQCWRFFRPDLLITLDKLRDRYGPTFCNTWALGERVIAQYGHFEYRGLRLPDELPSSSDFSGHRHGCAADLWFVDVTAEEVRRDILGNMYHDDFKLITEVELGTNWLHMACATNVQRILTYSP